MKGFSVLQEACSRLWRQRRDFVYLLAESTGFELANLGVVGTGSVSHLHYLEDYGLALDPEIVIWQFSSNVMVDDFDHVVNKGQGCPHWQAAEHASEEKAFKGLRNWLSRTFVTYNLVFAPAMRTIFPDLAGKAERHVPYEQVVTTDNQKLLAWMGNPPKDDPRSVKGMQLTGSNPGSSY